MAVRWSASNRRREWTDCGCKSEVTQTSDGQTVTSENHAYRKSSISCSLGRDRRLVQRCRLDRVAARNHPKKCCRTADGAHAADKSLLDASNLMSHRNSEANGRERSVPVGWNVVVPCKPDGYRVLHFQHAVGPKAKQGHSARAENRKADVCTPANST
jgi:hypothetical protein